MIEAKKLAYADMLRYDADPRFAKVPGGGDALEGLRRSACQADRSRARRMQRAGRHAARHRHGTTYLSVVDATGTWFR